MRTFIHENTKYIPKIQNEIQTRTILILDVHPEQNKNGSYTEAHCLYINHFKDTT